MKAKLIGIGALIVFVLIFLPILLAILVGRETTRDIILIAWGALTILSFLFFIMFLLSLLLGTRSLITNVKTVVNEDVRPIIHTGQESAKNVTGTTRFVSDTVVSPIIRLYGIIAGIRRGFSVFTKVSGRGKKKVTS